MNHPPVDILEETVAIPSGDRSLKGVLVYPFAGTPERAAIVIGPHPMMGGQLSNNVVCAVACGLAQRGFLTLRFQFGGDGLSADAMEAFWKTGHAPDDPCRGDEAVAAYRHLARIRRLPTVAVGYSFGASLLCGLICKPDVTHAVLIGATFVHHASTYTALSESTLPKLIIAADNDFATPLSTTRKWVSDAAEPKRLVVIDAAEHFYRDQEQAIVAEILQWTAT